MLTVARLRECLDYAPDTGVFTWKIATGRRRKVGDVAGAVANHGHTHYVTIQLDGMRTYAHRLAFLYMEGRWPKQVDHRDGDGQNNRWSNLREATQSENQQNLRGPRSHNQLGVLGVYPVPPSRRKRNGPGRFFARIVVQGRGVHLGTFATIEEAQAAYLAAKRVHHLLG